MSAPVIGYAWLDSLGVVHAVPGDGHIHSTAVGEDVQRVAVAGGDALFVERDGDIALITDAGQESPFAEGQLLSAPGTGQLVAVGIHGHVELRDLDGSLVQRVPCPDATAAAWGWRDTVLVAVCDGDLIHVDVNSGAAKSNPPPSPVLAVSAWGDGFAVVTVESSGRSLLRTPSVPQAVFGELGDYDLPTDTTAIVGGTETEGLIAMTASGSVVEFSDNRQVRRHENARWVAPLPRQRG